MTPNREEQHNKSIQTTNTKQTEKISIISCMAHNGVINTHLVLATPPNFMY